MLTPSEEYYFRHLLEGMRRHRTKRACIHLKVGAAVKLVNGPKTGAKLATLCYRAKRRRCLLRSCLDAYVLDSLSGMENAAPAATHSRRKKATRPSMASLRQDERENLSGSQNDRVGAKEAPLWESKQRSLQNDGAACIYTADLTSI